MQRCGLPLQHSDATITNVEVTASLPPRVAALGLATPVKAWQAADSSPTEDSPLQFREGFTYAPPGGSRTRVSHMAIHGRLLVLADSATFGTLTLWDVGKWVKLQTIQVALNEGQSVATTSASVACLAFDGRHIAVGTHQGEARTYKQPSENTDFVIMLAPLLVDRQQPVTQLKLSGGLLCAYSSSKQTFVTWRLEDGKLQHAWAADKVAGSRPLVHAVMVENLVASVHMNLGSAEGPTVQLLDVLTGEGGRIPDKGMLDKEGDALCLSFDGNLICVGFSGGAVVAFEVDSGYSMWKAYHKGAVGCVAVVPGESQVQPRVVSGGADRRVNLWSLKGELLATQELGGQITSLQSRHPRVLACGTHRGFVEVLLLPAPKGSPPLAPSLPARLTEPERLAVQYEQYFQDHQGGARRVAEAPEAFERFFAPADDSVPAAETAEASKKAGNGHGDEAVKTMAKGLKGAFSGKEGGLVSEEEERRSKEEAARESARPKDTSRPDLGDLPGVARCASLPAMEAKKCASTTCLARAVGKMKFLRCGRCKQVWYCSLHCQRTHWRDAHSAQCTEPVPPKTDVEQAAARGAQIGSSEQPVTTSGSPEQLESTHMDKENSLQNTTDVMKLGHVGRAQSSEKSNRTDSESAGTCKGAAEAWLPISSIGNCETLKQLDLNGQSSERTVNSTLTTSHVDDLFELD